MYCQAATNFSYLKSTQQPPPLQKKNKNLSSRPLVLLRHIVPFQVDAGPFFSLFPFYQQHL